MEEHARKIPHWEHEQTGELRYGDSFWLATNVSIPLAHLNASPKQIPIRIGLGKSKWQHFTISREHVRSVFIKRGLFSTGIQVEHDQRKCPPCVVFWPTSRERLLGEPRAMGHPVASG